MEVGILNWYNFFMPTDFSLVFIISQVLMFIAVVLIIVTFQVKKDKIFRSLFVISGILAGIHFILLSAPTAALIVFVNASRWFISIFSKNKYWFWLYIVLFIISLYFTYTSWISIVVFFAGVISTIAVFRANQMDARKIYIGVDALWIINNIIIFTPVGIVAHLLFMTSNIVGYQRFRK